MKKFLLYLLAAASVAGNIAGAYFIFVKFYGDKRDIPFIKNKIVIAGDSRVAGASWRKGLKRLDVVNAGIPGITSGQLLLKLDSILENRRPEYVVVQIGINDIRKSVSSDSIISNYVRILKILKNKPTKPILMSVISVRKDFFQDQIHENLINERVAQLNAILNNLAEQEKVLYVDVTEKMSVMGRLKVEYTYDGIHLNSEAEMMLYEILQNALI